MVWSMLWSSGENHESVIVSGTYVQPYVYVMCVQWILSATMLVQNVLLYKCKDKHVYVAPTVCEWVEEKNVYIIHQHCTRKHRSSLLLSLFFLSPKNKTKK